GSNRRMDEPCLRPPGCGKVGPAVFGDRCALRLSRRGTGSVLGLGVVVFLFGCTSDLAPRPCASDRDCESAGQPGTCLAAPSGQRWCAFASTTCPSHMRWGLFAGDGLSNACLPLDFDDPLVPDAPLPVDAGSPSTAP